MLEFRKMGLPDVPTVAPLFLEASQTKFWESGRRHDGESAIEMLSGYFRVPSHHWMIFRGADLAGYGHLLWSEYLEAWIVSYLVAPRFQGIGIATAFVGEAKRFARAEGIETLYASAHPENIASIRVIEKSGFQPTDTPATSEGSLYRWSPASESLDLRDP